MDPKAIISRFDEFLSERKLSFEAVVIGGAALSLLGIVSRTTRDCDILDPLLPVEIKVASQEFALAIRQSGDVLQDNWLNHEPSSLSSLLPPEWRHEVRTVFEGKAIILYSLGRLDLLRTKLCALCDRGTDLNDCIALKPTIQEIEAVLPWVQQQDTNPDWPNHVASVLADLGARLGHGV